MSAASITADRRIAFVCGQASSPSKPACGCRALPDVNRPRERRIRNAQSPKSLNQTLPVIKGQPQAQSQECLGKYLGVMPPNIKRFGFAHHDKTSGCGWVGRLKALLHQCVCVSCWLELLCESCYSWWQYRLCFLVHGLSHPRLSRPCQPSWQTVQITGSVFPIFQIYASGC